MFVDEAKLKAAMKTSWKGKGITLSRTGNLYTMLCDRFDLEIHKDFMTNKVKALIVELCGEIPEDGEGITFRKDCENQIALEVELPEAVGGDEIRRTSVLFVNHGETLMRVWKGSTCIAVPETLSFLTEGSLENGETEPEGPYLAGGRVIWKNNTTKLMVHAATAKDEEKAMLERFYENEYI